MKTGILKGIGDPKPEKKVKEKPEEELKKAENTRIFGGENDKQFWSDKPNGKIIKASELPDVKEKFLKKIKTKKEKAQDLKVKLDEVFSLFIRLKYADSNGMVKCYTSGEIMPWRKSQNGHFISRRYLAIRWDEDNCRPQSYQENMLNQGNAPEFARKLEIEIGKTRLTVLHLKKNNIVKIGVFEYNLLIDKYTKEYKKIAKQKGIEI